MNNNDNENESESKPSHRPELDAYGGVLNFKFCIGEACCARRSNPNVTYGHRLRVYLFIFLLACSPITPQS